VCFFDDATADFAAGTPSSQVFVSDVGGGEVILAPRPWSSSAARRCPTAGARCPGVRAAGRRLGRTVSVDASTLDPEPYAASAGASLEFVATFPATPYEHVGFAGGAHLPPNQIFTVGPWALFGTGSLAEPS